MYLRLKSAPGVDGLVAAPADVIFSNIVNAMKRVSILAAIGLLLLVGCGPVVNKVYLASEQYPPRPANHPIQLYSEKLPECEFQELAIVKVTPPTYGWPSLDTFTESLRNAVRELGGDAVIRLQMGEVMTTSVTKNSTTISAGKSLTGTVIRFLKDDCRK